MKTSKKKTTSKKCELDKFMRKRLHCYKVLCKKIINRVHRHNMKSVN